MKILPVDLVQLTDALEDQDRDLTAYYFDSQSGEIVSLNERAKRTDKRWEIIADAPDRFIPIEPIDSQKIALDWLAAHGIEPVEPPSTARPSPLDEEVEALENDDDVDDDDLDEDLEDFDEVEVGLSEDEEAELIGFVESLPGLEFNTAKFHGLLSAFASGPMIMSPEDILEVLVGSADSRSRNKITQPDSVLGLLARFYGGIIEAIEFESYEPELEQQGVEVTDLGNAIVSWCQGFMLAMELHKEAWKPWFEDVRREKAISLIVGISDPKMLRRAETVFGGETPWATANMISDLVPMISLFWKFESGLDDYLGPQPELN